MVRGLVKDALNPAMVLVGRTLLSTPQVAGEAQVRSYWQLSVGVADSLLVLVVMAAGALVMGHETLQTCYAIKDVLPRLAVAAIAVNASLAISRADGQRRQRPRLGAARQRCRSPNRPGTRLSS